MEKFLLSIRNLNKSFAAPVLKDVSLSIGRGEIHAIVGENGAGKSTLVNILTGQLRKDSGQVFLEGLEYEATSPTDAFAAGVSFAAQELSIIDTLTVAENIGLKNLPHKKSVIVREELDEQARDLMRLVGLDGISPDTRADSLSIADRQLLELAKALATDCRLLLLDEPTAALTSPQANHLHSIIADLAAAGTSVIYVSHRLDDVLAVADVISVLRDGQVVSSVPAHSLTVADMIEQMTGRNQQPAHKSTALAPSASPVLRIEELTTEELPHAISFTCHQGEIIGIAGLAGSGRSELLQALFGLTPATGGRVVRCTDNGEFAVRSASHAVKMGIGFLAEDRKTMGIFSGQSVLANMMLPGITRVSSSLGLIDRVAEADVGADLESKLEIKCHSLDQDIEQLSGGNQQKILLARWLNCDSAIFLLDEPTKGVDVGTKSAIYELLFEMQRKQKAIIIASSEIEELMTVCNRILVLSDRKLVKEFTHGEWSETGILEAAFQEFTKQSIVINRDRKHSAESTQDSWL